MDYQVWIKDEYTDQYTKVDCGDLAAARREIDNAVRGGQEPILTVEVPYSLAIKVEDVGAEKPKPKTEKKTPETKVEEGAKSEAAEDKAKPD